MKSFHPHLHTRSKSQAFREHIITSVYHHVHHISSSTCSSFPQEEEQDTAKIIAAHLSNCTSLPRLNQIYAHMIRTHMLQSHTAAFHWNNVIRSYAKLEAPKKALRIYISMSRSYVLPDCYTLPIVLKAACQLFDLEIGRQLHSIAVRVGLESNEFCESGFISLYSKAGEFTDARKVFDGNPERKLGSWNATIAGLSQGGRAKEAIDMFIGLKKCGFEPDDVTMVSVTSACGSLGDLELALQLHKYVFQAISMIKSEILMLNSLIDMYGKCGRMDLAYKVFSEMVQRNVSSWTSMIVGYAANGLANEALECFRCMRESGVRPNHVTFVGVLSACVHGGKVQEGKRFFEMMKNLYQIEPRLPHYGCKVDLLGRAGLLEEARDVVEGMPMKANVVIWGCLMGACEKFGNVKMGEWVAKHVQELEPCSDGAYVVLSNIYANKGLWEEAENIRALMKHNNLGKLPAYSLATLCD